MPRLSKLDQARLALFARIPHCAPDYLEQPWNKFVKRFLRQDSPSTLTMNNCFSYAVNDPEIYRDPLPDQRLPAWPEPNLENPWPIFSLPISHKILRQALQADGLIFAGRKLPELLPGVFPIAAFTSKSVFTTSHRVRRDYHFYRQDRNGFWSHKRGQEIPSDKNEGGKPIQSPRQDYKTLPGIKDPQFAGYFYVPNSGLAIGRRNRILQNPTSLETRRTTSFNRADVIRMCRTR